MTNSDKSPSNDIKEKKTIMSQMQVVEDCLKDSLHRVDVIEKNLATQLLTSERRERLEKELELVKEVLKKNDAQLKNLRKENTKSFIIVGTIVFAVYLIYGLYCMYYNTI